MIRSKTSQGRIRSVVAWALLLLLFAHASGVAAQEGCEVIGKDGEERECTFTEELASCVLDSQDSYEQCYEDADGFWSKAGCEVTHMADDFACLVTTPISWGLGKLF